MRQALFALLGLALGLALAAGLVVHVGLSREQGVALWQGMQPGWSLAVLALTALLMLAGAAKWAFFDRAQAKILQEPRPSSISGAQEPRPSSFSGAQEPRPAFLFFLRAYLWQNMLGQIIPPSLAIVAGRSLAHGRLAAQEGKTVAGAKDGAMSGLWDQGAEFLLLLGLVPASAYALLHASASPWGAFLGFALMGMAALVLSVRGILPAWLRGQAWTLWGWSALRVALILLRLWAGALAFGFSFSPLTIVAAAPLVSLLVVLPLSPGNLGFAEWGWTGALAFAGEDAGHAALYALGFRVLVLVVQGALLVFYEGARLLAPLFGREKRALP